MEKKNNTTKTFSKGRRSEQNIDSSTRLDMLYNIKKIQAVYISNIHVYCCWLCKSINFC